MNAFSNSTTYPRSAMSRYAKPAHKSAIRTLGYVLTLGTREAWRAFIAMLIVRLSREERVALAFSAMKSLDRNDAILTVEAAIDEGAGPPIPPLFSFIDEAAFWADMAHPEELEAYCLACFNAMSRTRQVAFLDHLQGRHAS